MSESDKELLEDWFDEIESGDIYITEMWWEGEYDKGGVELAICAVTRNFEIEIKKRQNVDVREIKQAFEDT